jgi:hypothetical protein
LLPVMVEVLWIASMSYRGALGAALPATTCVVAILKCCIVLGVAQSNGTAALHTAMLADRLLRLLL